MIWTYFGIGVGILLFIGFVAVMVAGTRAAIIWERMDYNKKAWKELPTEAAFAEIVWALIAMVTITLLLGKIGYEVAKWIGLIRIPS